MPHRTPCRWRSFEHLRNNSKVCHVCKGHVKVNGIEYCPFKGEYAIIPELQHLLTAEERYYSISQLRKLRGLREG